MQRRHFLKSAATMPLIGAASFNLTAGTETRTYPAMLVPDARISSSATPAATALDGNAPFYSMVTSRRPGSPP